MICLDISEKEIKVLNKKIKKIQRLFVRLNETLNNENKKKLTFLKSHGYIDNNDVEELMNKAGKKAFDEYDDWKIEDEKLSKYLLNKKLDKDNFSDSDDLYKKIIKLFDKNKKHSDLKTLLKNNGACTLKQIIKNNNIYSFCEGWEDIAKEIANFSKLTKNKNSIGDFELLLRFLLKGKCDKDNDCDILYKGQKIEVKSTTKNGHNGARICNKYNLKNADVIYENLINEICKNDSPETIKKEIKNIKTKTNRFFGSKKNVTNLENLLNDQLNKGNEIKIDDFILYLAESLVLQFENFQKINNKTVDNLVSKLTDLNNIYKFIKFNNKYTIDKNILNVVGFSQLYLYAATESFDYIIIILNNSCGEKAGIYEIFSKDDILDDNKYLNVLNLCKYTEIGNYEDEKSSRIGLNI